MLRTSRSRVVSLAGAVLLLVGAVGVTQAANPNRTYDFRACWDDGSVSGVEGLIGIQSWSAFRVTSVSFGFEHFAGGDAYSIPPSRSGSEQSGWFTPQVDAGDFIGALYARDRVVATGTVREPAGGWSTLPAC